MAEISNNQKLEGILIGTNDLSVVNYKNNIEKYANYIFLDSSNGDIYFNNNLFGYSTDAKNMDTSIINKISYKEDSSNKVDTWTDNPSDIKYPSEKLVKDSIDTISTELSNTEYVILKKFEEVDSAVLTLKNKTDILSDEYVSKNDLSDSEYVILKKFEEIDKKILENEQVAAAALNDLNTRLEAIENALLNINATIEQIRS